MRVGFIQYNPVFGQVKSNLSTIESLLSYNVADLMVLPELFNTGYNFLSREEARILSETIPEGLTTQTLIHFCKKNQISIIAGLAEYDGDQVFNSAVVVGPELPEPCAGQTSSSWLQDRSFSSLNRSLPSELERQLPREIFDVLVVD